MTGEGDIGHATPTSLADFGASIGAFVGRDLTAPHLEEGYLLSDGDRPLALLGELRWEKVVRGVAREGEWWFSRLRGAGIEVREQPGEGPVIARYRSGILPGGQLELPDGMKLRLRPPLTGETWRVRRGRDAIAAFTDPWKPWTVRLTPTARDVSHLPLLTLLAFAAVLVELDVPSGGAAPVGYSG